MAFGSDFPVEVVSPLWGIYGGLTRKAADGTPPGGWHPEHRLSIDQILKGFTSGSAYAQFAEDRLGKIQTGFRADFVVFDRNLLKTEESDILKIKTLATWIDGEAVFQTLP